MYKQWEWIYNLLIRLFNHFLEPGYTQLAKGIKLIPKCLKYIIIGDI
jgi:hypothetical protein